MKHSVAKRLLQLAVGLAISVFFIWLSLREVALGNVFDALEQADLRYLAPYLAILVAIHFCRTLRWGILLEPIGKPTFDRLNLASAVGFMGLVVMPFRLGEFARPLLIAEHGKIRSSAAMGSIVVERVVDGLAMALVLFVALFFSTPVTSDPSQLAWARRGGVVVFCIFLVILFFSALAYAKREFAVGLVRRLTTPISSKLADKLAEMLDAFIGGLRLVPDRRKIALFFAMTLAYWAMNGFGLQLLALGFGLDLDVAAAFTILGLLVIGVMIPAGPGMLGTFQGAIILGTELFFPGEAFKSAVFAYAWVVWAAQFGQQVLFGLYYVVRGRVSLSRLWQPAPEPDAEPKSEPEPTAPGGAL
ncbi:MAG: flippase-like domain-containing protein [Myxococcales bacterium]|jgi:uncharacterized protein (TIRG00374 family)|nr:flippase-like domain-containing protein [Myxococcales bacterium]